MGAATQVTDAHPDSATIAMTGRVRLVLRALGKRRRLNEGACMSDSKVEMLDII
jgi:hypothetical protein